MNAIDRRSPGAALDREIVLGMPELDFTGLCENWLLKTCGDLHWQAICGAMGRTSDRITDTNGRRLYPSFVALAHDGASLAAFRENDRIRISPRVRAVSARRVWSRHTITHLGSGARKTLDMLSLFTKRGCREETNKDLSSGAPMSALSLEPYDPDTDASTIVGPRHRQVPEDGTAELPGIDRRFRVTNAIEHLPCPATDFNGAKLLYFASFQSILDRAEWQHFRAWPLETFSCRKRTIRYFGNADPKDAVRITFIDAEITDSGILHHAEMMRVSDGKTIAEFESEKTVRAEA